ncbi:DUF4265 domain-containing protein [Flavihumibacter profundi]|jgi:hypothetical protein|uniref:DUF4265 domain-containing protein n=1 Tax=Flavihumibacter profundi TaxID=2716883 RepID=UPI001CC3B06D|nr:DUF4265 domain-containing protein [Flavihumibacter profundi]MBZ5857395.1 DUF4265 domain-containing protein [Flavihumibacter profundi]
MTQTKDNSIKILFRFFSNVLDEWTVETMLADTVDAEKGFYKLDSIPFYAPVASDDIVFAEYDDTEEILKYRNTVESSGNSTVQVVLIDTTKEINTIRDKFKDMGCISEKLNDRYFAMEIPVDKDYIPIKFKLIELEDAGIISYAEPWLSQNHCYD